MTMYRLGLFTSVSRARGWIATTLIGLSGVLACSSDDGSGSSALSVLVEPEDVIIDGLTAGDGPADVQDGWDVSFDRYVVAVGDVSLQRDGREREAHDMFAVDLRRLSSSGEVLWEFDSLAEGRWDFVYATLEEELLQGPNVADEDFQRMVDGGLTHLIEGTLSQSGGSSCPPTRLADIPEGATSTGTSAFGDECYENSTVRFLIEASVETVYGPCEIDGLPGVATSDGQTASAAISIHGDHIFFSGFPTGSEARTARRAQWLADSDLNLDGLVTMDELAQIEPSDLLDENVFQLGGSPLAPLDSLATYVLAQLKTQGHYQGEGECPVDGVEHEHAHDDEHDEDHAHEEEHADEDHAHE